MMLLAGDYCLHVLINAITVSSTPKIVFFACTLYILLPIYVNVHMSNTALCIQHPFKRTNHHNFITSAPSVWSG